MKSKKLVKMSRDRLTATYTPEKETFREFDVLGLIYQIPECKIADMQFACSTRVRYDTKTDDLVRMGCKLTYHEETNNPTRNCYEFRRVTGDPETEEVYYANWQEDLVPAVTSILDEVTAKYNEDHERYHRTLDAIEALVSSIASGEYSFIDTTVREINYTIDFIGNEITMNVKYGSVAYDYELESVVEVNFSYKDGDRNAFVRFIRMFSDVEQTRREAAAWRLPPAMEQSL